MQIMLLKCDPLSLKIGDEKKVSAQDKDVTDKKLNKLFKVD